MNTTNPDSSPLWTLEQKERFSDHIRREVQENDRLAAYNNWWAVNLVVAIIVLNGFAAIAAASSTSTEGFIALYRPWFTYGAAVLMILSGVATTLLQANRVGYKKLAYRNNAAGLKQLLASVELDEITKKDALARFVEITSKNPEE